MHDDLRWATLQRYNNSARMCMLGDVGQRFLHDAEYCGRVRRWQVYGRVADDQFAGQARTLPKALDQPFDCRNQAQIIEDQGDKVKLNQVAITSTLPVLRTSLEISGTAQLVATVLAGTTAARVTQP